MKVEYVGGEHYKPLRERLKPLKPKKPQPSQAEVLIKKCKQSSLLVSACIQEINRRKQNEKDQVEIKKMKKENDELLKELFRIKRMMRG